MSEFKKGDIIKDERSGLLFRITGYASYLVVGRADRGCQQATSIDWDDAVQATDEDQKSFIEAERESLRKDLLATRARFKAHEAALTSAIANKEVELERLRVKND